MAETKVSEDEIKVLEKLQKIKKDQWKAMRPMFEQLYEIAQEGGVSDFLTETFTTFYDTMIEAVLLPFAPLIEIASPEIAKLFEETLPDFVSEMEQIAEIVRNTLGIEIAGVSVGEALSKALGFILALITNPSETMKPILDAMLIPLIDGIRAFFVEAIPALIEGIIDAIKDLFFGDGIDILDIYERFRRGKPGEPPASYVPLPPDPSRDPWYDPRGRYGIF